MATEQHWLDLDGFRSLPAPIRFASITLGDGSLGLIAGPCSIESESLCMQVAESLVRTCGDLGIPYVFKASFDKANRTAVGSWRGAGLDDGLKILERVKQTFDVPLLTDVHETDQVATVASVVDVLQIPAFLCRQTDLLMECGRQLRPVNIKKGQFLPPEDMRFAAEKVVATGERRVLLSERGTTFGYRDLVVDMRSLVIMRSLGYPVVFDATHSVQQLGGLGGASGGKSQFIPAQVRAAVAVGVDALFMETHPTPESALSDGPTMVPLARVRDVLAMALDIHALHGVRGSVRAGV